MRYGVPPGVPGESKNVIAYETKGKAGKRFVVYAGGKMEQVDDAKFNELVPAPGSPAGEQQDKPGPTN